jgi:hypothetical protein
MLNLGVLEDGGLEWVLKEYRLMTWDGEGAEDEAGAPTLYFGVGLSKEPSRGSKIHYLLWPMSEKQIPYRWQKMDVQHVSRQSRKMRQPFPKGGRSRTM